MSNSRDEPGAADHLTSCESVGALDETPEATLARGLARELRRQWRVSRTTRAEAFLARHPDLWETPEAAVELVYEEYCLRRGAGESGVEEELLGRFPQWAGPLGVMLDCHRRLMEGDRRPPSYPRAGDELGDFEVVREIARGARGRVFLARQRTLAGRPVVLKVTPLDGGEHLSLARLQHTNIVPLYSVHDDAERDVRALCMPYFGGATLATLQQGMAGVPVGTRTGRHLVDALDAAQDSSCRVNGSGAARQMLAHASFVQAVCWMAACLADALQFAHEHGVVHLDLKPSNVLVGADGQPMLLDFHLARAPIVPGSPVPGHIGGTPQYMPPEQLAAMRALRDGGHVGEPVDARADVYALGVMLHECLGGASVSPDSPPSAGLAALNPQVTPGLSDLVARCVSRSVHARYPDARTLAEDLRRHITDQPLLGVPNRSAAERWRKWRRRKPSRLRATTLLAVVVMSAAVVARTTWRQRQARLLEAEAALADGDRQLGGRDYAEAVRSFERGSRLAGGAHDTIISQRLRDRLASARRLHLAHLFHGLAEAIRPIHVPETPPNSRLRSLAVQCAAVWEQRSGLADRLRPAPGAEAVADVVDLAIFLAQVRKESEPDGSIGHEHAARVLDEAEALVGPNVVIDHERHSHRSSPGMPRGASVRAGDVVARSAWEATALARSFLRAGDAPSAMQQLEHARRLEPASLWANFHYGVCAYRLRRFDDAVAAFSTCIGASPRDATLFHNRALAYAATGRADLAAADRAQAAVLGDPSRP